MIIKGHEIVKDVISTYPEAASIPDSFGKLPLHASLYAGKTWDSGIKEIFEAAPHAIHVQDFRSFHFPFMIAACNKDDIKHQQHIQTTGPVEQDGNVVSSIQKAVFLSEITTIFELLRRAPSQLYCSSTKKLHN